MDAPHILIVEARDHAELVDELAAAAQGVLDGAGATAELVAVPGPLDIPAAIAFAMRSMEFFTARRRFDGYVALGCLERGDTVWYDVATVEAVRGLQDLAQRHAIAIGNGILLVEGEDQAWVRAAVNQRNYGARAARACLDMVELKRQFRLFPR